MKEYLKKQTEKIMFNVISIAVIDSATTKLWIYDAPKHWNSERIEDFLTFKGHHLSNCSWGIFDGIINDERDE